jgi:hypothetical protein
VGRLVIRMLPLLKSPETLYRLCPLGVRFWDEVTQAVVTDGLTVMAAPKPAWNQGIARLLKRGSRLGAFPALPAVQQVIATPNHSGIYVFRSLPGLRDAEQGTGDDQFWAGPLGATKHAFVVGVDDSLGRFLPFAFEVQLPCRGLFNLDCDLGLASDSPVSPPVSALARAPLFSTPSRPVPAGMAVVRADLWDVQRAIPAAWAMLRFAVNDPIRGTLNARGLADDRGCLLALFRYPEPNESYPLSPPYTGSPLATQGWEVEIEAHYTRVGPQSAFVDLCSALGQQAGPAATLMETASPPVPLTRATLAFDQELILKSADSLESRLFVT